MKMHVLSLWCCTMFTLRPLHCISYTTEGQFLWQHLGVSKRLLFRKKQNGDEPNEHIFLSSCAIKALECIITSNGFRFKELTCPWGLSSGQGPPTPGEDREASPFQTVEQELEPHLREYLFIQHIADSAIQRITQLLSFRVLLSCLRHAMQLGYSLLWLSLKYLRQPLFTDGIWLRWIHDLQTSSQVPGLFYRMLHVPHSA